MLTYLQGNTHPDIAMATHQLAQFCQDPRLIHEQAATRLADIFHTLKTEALSMNLIHLWA
jgi:hypothetical protein